MTAFAIGWGVFWLLVWAREMWIHRSVRRSADWKTSKVGIYVSLAWIAAFSVVRWLP